jgi:hypothetical protein
MRRISAVGLVAALLLSVGSLRAADPQPSDDSGPAPWYKRMFTSSKAKAAEKKPEPVEEKAPTREEVAKSLDLEQKTYLQRLEFCTKLRQIGVETKDEALVRKAEALEQMAHDRYLAKTSKLPAILQDVKAAEAKLEEKKNWGSPSGSASAGQPKRAPNGRAITTPE